jgi:hypothetical protein
MYSTVHKVVLVTVMIVLCFTHGHIWDRGLQPQQCSLEKKLLEKRYATSKYSVYFFMLLCLHIISKTAALTTPQPSIQRNAYLQRLYPLI